MQQTFAQQTAIFQQQGYTPMAVFVKLKAEIRDVHSAYLKHLWGGRCGGGRHGGVPLLLEDCCLLRE
eukprot:256661-Pyramimonas_sp.AAC.1